MSRHRGAAGLRVVSLVPAATEIIVALGEADSLVGVSHECAPGDALTPPPRVTGSRLSGSMSALEIDTAVSTLSASGAPLFTLLGEEIEALRPDIIITQGLCNVCAVSEDDVRALAARLTPTPRVISISATTLDGVFSDIGTIASALDVADVADGLLALLRGRMKRVHTVLAESRAPRPRAAVIEWTDPLFAAGHWVPEMIYRAGGTDVLAVSGQHSREVTWNSLTDSAPDVVLIAPCGYEIERAVREGRELVASHAWLGEHSVWALDAVGLVSQPGPRLVDGIETIASILHPGLFDPPSTLHAIRLTTS